MTTLEICNVLLCAMSICLSSNLESDQHSSNGIPKIRFRVYTLTARYTVHGRNPFNEKKQCKLWGSSTDSIGTEKTYTRKELVMMETSIVDFHQQFHIPAIQTFVLHLLDVHTIGTHHCGNLLLNSLNRRSVYHNVLCHRYCAELLLASFCTKLNLNTIVVIDQCILKEMYWNTSVLQTK